MRTKLITICLLLVLSGIIYAQQMNLKPDMIHITIGISGYVDYPGTYKMLPVDRLSDALAQARMAEEQRQVLDINKSPELDTKKLNPIPILRAEGQMFPNYDAYRSLRDVRLIRNGEERVYDILAFMRTGDQSQNPFLRDGDQIHVPLIRDFISVNGSVGFPGDMEYREGDTIRKVLDLALGTLPGADLSSVRLSIYNPVEHNYSFRNLNLAAEPSLWDLSLNPGDRLMVPYSAQYRNKIAITVSGEVVHSGEFNVPENTSLWELIQIAGGLTDEADISNAVVLNKLYNQEPDPEFERLKTRGMLELTPMEYSYLRISMRQAKGKYSVDFKKLVQSQGMEGDIILNNGDFIHVPQKLNMVWVSGQVRRPGMVPFKEGENWKYYIQQAGGYTNNRSFFGTRVLRASSGNWVKASSKMEVRPGDVVLIPDRQDRYFWTDLKDIIGVTASAITILIGVQNLTK